jgi:hypothetical protein
VLGLHEPHRLRPIANCRLRFKRNIQIGGFSMRFDRAWLLILILLSAPLSALAQGGPPMITDDPDTPGPGYWEINLSAVIEKSQSERRYEAPGADINYGLGKRIQLKFEIPWINAGKPGEPLQAAAGNSNSGVKWRFLGQEGQRLAWSIYPQLELNTGQAALKKGLVDEGPRFLMPTEVTVQIGRLELDGEVGREFVKHGDNGWVAGLLTEFEFSRASEFLAELHAEKNGAAPAELILNFGARQKLTEQLVLLMSAGTAVAGLHGERTDLRIYIGLQLNLPNVYDTHN